MRILSVSWFGFTVLTLAHAFYLPTTKDYPTTPPPTTEGDNHYGFTCPDGWSMHSTQCLLFVPQNMTWKEAKKNCESKGQGSLTAVYGNMQTYEMYVEIKKKLGIMDKCGLEVAENPGIHLVPGGDYSFFHGFADFYYGESGHNENNCLQITFKGDSLGYLGDMKCDVALPSICAILL